MATPPDEDKETAKDIRRQQKKVLNGLLETPLEADKKEMKQFLIREFTQESERVWARLLEDQLKPAFERIMDELVDLKYTKMKSHIEAHMERMMANYELRPSYDASGRVTSWAYVTKERHIPTPQQQQQSNRPVNLPAGFIFGGSGYQARMQQQSQSQQPQQRFYPTMNQRPSNAAPLQQQAFQQQAQGQVQFQGGNNLSSSQPQQQPTMNGNVDVRMQNVIQNRRPEITAVNGQSGSRYLMQLRLQQLQQSAQVSQGGQAVLPNGTSYENNHNNAAAALQAQRLQAARVQSSMGPQMISGQTQPIQQQMQPQQVQQRRPSAPQQQYTSSGAMANGHVQQSPVQSPHSQPPPPYPSSQGGSQQVRQPSPNAGGHRSPGFSSGQQQPMLHQQRFQAAPSANIIAAIPLNSQQGLPGQVILLNVSQQSSVQQPAPQQSANMPNTFAPQPAVTCNPLKYVNFKSSYTFASSTAPSSPNTVSPSPTSRPNRSQSATTPTPTSAQQTEQSPTAQSQPTWYPSSLHTLLTSPTRATVSTTAVVTMASTPTTTSTSTSNESPIAAPSTSPISNNSSLTSTLSMPSMNTLVQQQQQHPPQPNNNTDNTVSLIPTSRENVFILGDSDILDILDDPFEAISPAAPAANGEQSSLAEDGVVVQNQNQEPEQMPQSEQNSNSVPTAPVDQPPPPPQSNGHANIDQATTTSASTSGTSSVPAAPAANVVHIKTEVEEGITRVITKKPKRKKRKHANGQTHEMIQVKKERIEGEVEISGQQQVVQEQQQEVPQEQQAEENSDSDDDCQIVYIDDDFDASRLPFVPKEEPTEGINEVENVGQFGEGQQPQPEQAEQQNNNNNMDELNLADLEYDYEVHGGDEALLVDAADQINGLEDGGLPELVDAGQNVAEFNSNFNDPQAQEQHANGEQHNVQEYNLTSSTSDRPSTSSSSMASRPSTSTSSLNISDSEPSSATRDRRTFIALRKSCRYLKCRELLPPEEVERHELEVHGMQKYPCRLAGCRKSFPENIEEGKEKQAKLYEHLEEKHNDLPKICCTVCLAPFPIIGSQPIKNVYKKYDNHIRSTHDKGEFRCNIAGCTDTTIFTILKDIERHLRAFHNSTLGKAGREG